MASYPTSAKTFASRSAGQTIGSAHMNDVQDEINALETALLGTLQHDVTLASGQRLNVGGNSTFTGSVVPHIAPG